MHKRLQHTVTSEIAKETPLIKLFWSGSWTRLFLDHMNNHCTADLIKNQNNTDLLEKSNSVTSVRLKEYSGKSPSKK